MQSVGGAAKPTDPVGAVIMRLARKAIQKAKASKSRQRRRSSGWPLSIGWLPNTRKRMMRQLRPRAAKNRRAGKRRGRASAGEKGRASAQRQEGRLTFRLAIMEPDSTRLHFYLAVAWRVVRRSARRVSWCPTSLRSHGRPFVGRRDGIISNRDQPRGRAGLCINQNIRTQSLTPILCGVIVCVTYVRNPDQ